tara:strand:- start:3698 stop:5104 length:1407 start_codon:yes stop_codon:yes gene_type:complete
MRRALEYSAVNKYPFFKGYVEEFGKVSIDNDIPGMLSFFFIQGQVAAPYVRIPWDATHLDPRVHSFWIQPSRTGKSIAWEFVGKVLNDCGVPTDSYNGGSDAGLIGGTKTEVVVDPDTGKKSTEIVETEGLLHKRLALNFDEGSILLNPSKNSQDTVLYLQTACNPIGSNSNVIVKHLSGRRFEIKPTASMWVTTYPPAGVKEYVLTKGIFQRVLLYWSHWDMHRRKNVSQLRMNKAYAKSPESTVSYQEIVEYFRALEKRLFERVRNLAGVTFAEWDDMDSDEREETVQSVMWEMFTADESFYAATYDVIDDFYSLLDGLSFAIADVVASFVPAMENYSVILATHIAMMDEAWVITGDHLDMAKDILYDLFKNLISWLEGEVEVGAKKVEKAAHKKEWMEAFNAVSAMELDTRGDGWKRKTAVMKQYMVNQHVTKPTAHKKFNDWVAHMFQAAKDGAVVYIRLKEGE